jgi:transcriptional regulator with XRE-family HTH domain
MYEQWQDIREQRFALGREQKDLAAALAIWVSTLQRVETGQWSEAHVLLLVALVLRLEIWQAVEVRRNAPPARRRRR